MIGKYYRIYLKFKNTMDFNRFISMVKDPKMHNLLMRLIEKNNNFIYL